MWNFLFGSIPWEVWLVVGIAASIALAMMVPTRLGFIGASLLMILTCTTAAYSHGVHYGENLVEARVKQQVDAEKARLQEEFGKQLQLEQARATAAEQAIHAATKERDDAIMLAAKDPNAGDVAIPEYLVDSLCGLTGGCEGSSTPGRASRPSTLRGLLQRVSPAASPKGRVVPQPSRQSRSRPAPVRGGQVPVR